MQVRRPALFRADVGATPLLLRSEFKRDRSPPSRLLAAAPLVALTAGPALAVDQVHDEIQVYNAEINNVGQWSYEQHLNYAGIGQTRPEFPGGFTSNHSLQGTPEFAYGVTNWWGGRLLLAVLRLLARANFSPMGPRFAACPRDFMELLLIRQVQNETWRILRYTRHRTLGIDRRFRESLELQTRAQKEQAARRGALAKELAKQTGRSETELAQVLYLRGIVMSSVDDVDAILSREPTEIEHNKALEAGIVFQEQLDRLINSSLKRRNEAIEQLDFYRAGFGQRWREISDQNSQCRGHRNRRGQADYGTHTHSQG